jgi:drug/metabolite transporter (DMT)-like permease
MNISSPGDAVRAANRRGIAAMSLAMASFVTNDSLSKVVSESLNSAQLIFIRGVFATVLLLIVAQVMGALRGQNGEFTAANLRAVLQRPVLIRAGLDAIATLTYLTSLFHMPIGNATAINMATPLFITVFAVLAFKEQVSPARWLAIGTGFAGVLLVVQPSAAGFNAYALLCLAGTLFHSGRDLITRTIDKSVPSVLITLATAVTVTLLSGAISAAQGWQPVGTRHLVQLAAASVFLSIGYFLIIVGMRNGEMSVIAPFRYTGLLFALIIGWTVWGDVPNALAFIGITLLVGAGLYVLHSERGRARAELEAASD